MFTKQKLVDYLKYLHQLGEDDVNISYSTFAPTRHDDSVIVGGWSDGYDPKDTTDLHSKSQPTYCMCVKVAMNTIEDAAYADYGDASEPYDPWTEEFWETELTLPSKMTKKTAEEMADQLIEWYEKAQAFHQKYLREYEKEEL